MAIAIGNTTWVNPVVNATSYSSNDHTQDSGTDAFLYVEVVVSGTWTVPSVTWDGVTMTLLDVNFVGAINLRQYRFYLSTPATGTRTIQINFSSNYTTSFAWYAQSFTGTSGIADHDWTGLAASPHITNPTVGNNDVLIGSGMSLRSITNVNLDGIDYFAPSFTVYANVQADQYVAQLSGLLTAGTNNVEIDAGAPSFLVTNAWVKFSESAEPSGSAEGSWWLLMK